MIIVCGNNNYNQLGEKSTTKNRNDVPIIKDPTKFHVDPSTIISFNVFRDHGVLITRNGSMKGIGFNTDGKISSTLPNEILSQFTEFTITDEKGSKLNPISAICSSSFTLYMVSKGASDSDTALYFCYSKINNGKPLFVNLNGHKPKAIFGGFFSAAAIDSEGKVIFIYPAQLIVSPKDPIESIPLPNGEKAVKVVCCFEFVLALSESGKVFESDVGLNKNLDFESVSELESKEIIDIAGSADHCLAVSKEGHVFGRGTNKFLQIGLDEEVEEVNVFTEIPSLNKYKVVAAYAGPGHSLFQTETGQIIACGCNLCGELVLGCESVNEMPVETAIKSGASFCIAGYMSSVVFVDCEPPPHMPNMRVEFENPAKTSAGNSTECVSNEQCSFLGVDEIDKLKRIKLIGQGGQSHVYLVSRGKDGKKYALKELENRGGTESENFQRMKRFVQEFEVIKLINHQNIIKTFGICLGDKTHPPSILLEFYPFNLSGLVSKMSDLERVTVTYEICAAMSEVHKLNLIHRDLKPENILLDENKHVKVCDFGIAALNEREDGETSMTPGIGTLMFMAPELINNEDDEEEEEEEKEEKRAHYNNKVDVYAFGVVLFFIMTKGKYPKISIAEIALGKKAPIPNFINDFTKNLILRCWSTNPDDRPSFSEIVDEIKANNFKLIDGIEDKLSNIKQFLNIKD